MGLRRVLHTLAVLEARASTPYASRRLSSSSGSIPIEITGKIRPVRARSANYGHGRDPSGSASTGDQTISTSSSPSSSKFTDYSFASSARHSLDQPPPIPLLSSSPVPSISFADRAKDPVVSNTGAGLYGNRQIYSDRRMAESAIDVLSVVEEDEGSTGRLSRANSRHSQPVPLGRDASPPPRPSPSTRRTTRFSLNEKVTWLDTTTAVSSSSQSPARKRHSSDMARPAGLGGKRSFSFPAAPPGDAGVKRHASLASIASMSYTVVPSSGIPFPPSPEKERNPGPQLEPLANDRRHKRWNSELHVEKPFGKEDLPSLRHESLAVGGGGSGWEGEKRSPAPRMKLVLREDGRPTLTYVRLFSPSVLQEGNKADRPLVFFVCSNSASVSGGASLGPCTARSTSTRVASSP